MSCMHCVNHVKNALGDIQGISNIQVNLEENNASVELDNVTDEAIKAAIEEAGYEVVEIKEI